MQSIISSLGSFLWGPPMIIAIMGCGILLTVSSKFFVFRHFGMIFKKTLGAGRADSKQKDGVSPFEAICIAVGGAVGVGSLGGVAAAIAVGGPGALFWILAWAFFGMTVKVAEVSLACYYRCRDSKGDYYGGPSYYIERGLGEDKGYKWAKVLACCFGVAFLLAAFSGNQVYTIAEALNTTFHIPMIPFAFAYSLFVFYITWKGTPRIANFASKLVPFMCLLYFAGGIILILLNFRALPGVIQAVVTDAFTGSAAAGGFVGAGVMTVIRTGIARSINSNEAGQGSSPMIHAAANTRHPVEQGLWGAIEVFVSTVLVSTITALAILSTGTWTSGLTSVSLTIYAFQSAFGQFGLYFIGVIALLFGITTTAGWFTYYCSLIAHGFRKNEKLRDRLILIFKIIFPWPNVIVVTLIELSGQGPNLYWAMIDMVTVLPTFFNVIALIGLSGVFVKLLNDYKARYMGIGQIDSGFQAFYDNATSAKKGE
ncbi:alanine/glycine:cation symporter family protein [Anaerotruncus colihominis]|uniref:alanine/glycine:cation symporter family protein n=1 Tax=Anaerotruncus colihominis TaxID=169435 RepID=UPI001898CF92|nr:amino acid carrier protein [Anaerotruncus colihominis]MBS4860867.1 sodium:alanine symporter family protein [Eubacterium limosum]